MSNELDHIAESLTKHIKSRVEEYIVKLSLEDKLMVKYARGEPSVTQSWRTLSLSLYLARDGKIATTSLSAENPERLIDQAIAALELVRPSPFYAPLPEPTGRNSSFVDDRVKHVAETGDASKQLEELGLDEVRDVAGKIEFWYRRELLVSSTGAELRHESTSFNGYVRVFIGESSGQWSWTGTAYSPETARKAITVAKDLAMLCSRLPRRRLEPGRYRVLLSPMVVADLANTIAMAASAGSIIFGMSFFQDSKPGDKVLNDKFTLLDKPLDNTMPLFRGFDDEGVGTRDKAIIQNGVLKTLLHNSKTAKAMKTVSTGNAGWIMPVPFNLEVGAGDASLEELLESLREGVYITNNWYTRFQSHVEGVFSTVSRDAVIVYENSEPKYCAERVRIADVLPRLFSSIELVGSENWPIQWWEVSIPTKAPYILFRDAYLSLPT